MEEVKEQRDNRANILPHQWKKGQSGNPAGRPKGATKTLKQWVKERIENLTDEERDIFLEGIDKKTIWEMSEGKPKQDIQADVEITKRIISVDE